MLAPAGRIAEECVAGEGQGEGRSVVGEEGEAGIVKGEVIGFWDTATGTNFQKVCCL